MALRPNILTDAALHIAFEASILLQYTDINLYKINTLRYLISYAVYIKDGYLRLQGGTK